MENFNRQYRVRFGANDSSGVEIGAPDCDTKRSIHCSFSIELGDKSSPNTGKISLWNLSPESISLLNQPDCVIELRAGYGDDTPIIMGGTVTYIESTKSGADVETKIELEDSFTATRDTSVSLSYSGTVNGKKVITDAATLMGCTVRFSPNAVFKAVKNFAYVGTGAGLIEKVCDYSNLRWSIQNGIVQICAPGEAITVAAFLLSADTGLIGIPSPVSSSSETSDSDGSNSTKRKTTTGWKVTYLLNGHIQIDDLVLLQSNVASGNYRVSKIAISGDNQSGDWICTATLLEVT